MEVSHGLGVCGLPVVAHLVSDGQLERIPSHPYSGIRLLVTDLHLLGPTQARPEQYIAALISFIKQLILPSTYLIVFWSNYANEAAEAWDTLHARVDPALKPFGYEVLAKDDAAAAATGSLDAIARVQLAVETIIKKYPQLQAVMEWEASASKSAAETTNQFVRTLESGGVSFKTQDDVKKVMARMAQEALGYPHAPKHPTRGVTQAFLPIAQEWMERDASNGYLDSFLELADTERIALPSTDLTPLLNDFFVHAPGDLIGPLDRGAVIRLAEGYLVHKDSGLSRDIGLSEVSGDWKEAVCREFSRDWGRAQKVDQDKARNSLDAKNVYAVELSAECDHAQNKPRAQRFLLALFLPSASVGNFYSKTKGGANESIYVTPEITIDKVPGRLLVSCRIFFTRPHGAAPDGAAVMRLRKDVIEEISHLYASHMRRPGKIAFY
jgi:hypothetical protein